MNSNTPTNKNIDPNRLHEPVPTPIDTEKMRASAAAAGEKPFKATANPVPNKAALNFSQMAKTGWLGSLNRLHLPLAVGAVGVTYFLYHWREISHPKHKTYHAMNQVSQAAGSQLDQIKKTAIDVREQIGKTSQQAQTRY